MSESNLEYALNIMANLAAGMSAADLTDKEVEALDFLCKLGEKAHSAIVEREMDQMFNHQPDCTGCKNDKNPDHPEDGCLGFVPNKED